MNVYKQILDNTLSHHKMLVVLLDPEKQPVETLSQICKYIIESKLSMIFVGGSGFAGNLDDYIKVLRRLLPETCKIVLFPGHIHQISEYADAVLFLSFLNSGADTHFTNQQAVARQLYEWQAETIPMGYMLIDGGKQSATQRTVRIQPFRQEEVDSIVDAAIAGEMMGQNIIYLEAGSGATTAVNTAIIEEVRDYTYSPLIVGGGIKSIEQMNDAFNAGADIVVIGNFFEKQPEQIPIFAQNIEE